MNRRASSRDQVNRPGMRSAPIRSSAMKKNNSTFEFERMLGRAALAL